MTGVKTFFSKKRLAELAKFNDKKRIILLKEGLVSKMAKYFINFKPMNLAHFYKIERNAGDYIKQSEQPRNKFEKDTTMFNTLSIALFPTSVKSPSSAFKILITLLHLLT